MAKKERARAEFRETARKADHHRVLSLQENAEENRYVSLMEEQRILNRALAASAGGDATVTHIN